MFDPFLHQELAPLEWGARMAQVHVARRGQRSRKHLAIAYGGVSKLASPTATVDKNATGSFQFTRT